MYSMKFVKENKYFIKQFIYYLVLGEFFVRRYYRTIFIPGIIIPANLLPGVFTAAGITEWSVFQGENCCSNVKET